MTSIIDNNNIDIYKINIQLFQNDDFEIIAILSNKIYKKFIDEEFYSSKDCPPFIKIYKSILQEQLTKQINSETKYSSFFKLNYKINSIELSFVLDFNYVKENITLELFEFIEESIEQKLNIRIKEMESVIEEMKEEIEELQNSKQKTYILDFVEYDDEEDMFMKEFNWDLANQAERNKYIKLCDKYFIITMADHVNNKEKYLQVALTKVEPLCLTIKNGFAHVHGWFQIDHKNGKSKEIIIPKIYDIYANIPRIIQDVSSPYVGPGFLILNKNKLNIIGEVIGSGIGIDHLFCSENQRHLLNNPMIKGTNKRYISVNTKFLINSNYENSDDEKE
jgi:hypothetical protein